MLWHWMQSARTRWSSIFCRIVGSFALPVASAARGGSGGTSGGGSGGLMPRMFLMIHLPRVTGEVRSGFDVVVRNAPLPSRPRRRSMSGAERDAAELAAVDVRDAVVLGQPLVDERVVRRQQIGDAAILADDAVEQQLDFAPHRLTQRIVEVGIEQRQRADALQAAQVQPLAREVDRQRLGPRILQHAPDLLLEHGRILQPALAARRVISSSSGLRAPEEERQPRREIEIADAIRPARLRRAAGSASMR